MKIPNIQFIQKRKLFFTFTLILIAVLFCISLVRGYRLDIEFKGGSLVEYSFTGDLSANDALNVLQKTMDKPINCQISKNLGDDAKKLVVSVAGSEPLTTEELDQIGKTLESSFPDQSLELSNSLLVSPTMGREMLTNGLIALAIASALILLYVWFSFRKMSGPSAGCMALVALFHDTVLTFLAYVISGSAINETLIAVILTILGFSINDTIVVYDRIRENMGIYGRSKSLDEIVNISLNQSLSRTIMTSVCMFIAVVIAYGYALAFDLDSIKEFAFPILVGIISGTYSSLAIAAPLWTLWQKYKHQSQEPDAGSGEAQKKAGKTGVKTSSAGAKA